jgi:hypothetical protein
MKSTTKIQEVKILDNRTPEVIEHPNGRKYQLIP